MFDDMMTEASTMLSSCLKALSVFVWKFRVSSPRLVPRRYVGPRIIFELTIDGEEAPTDHFDTKGMSKTNTTWSKGWAKDKRGWSEDQGTDVDSELQKTHGNPTIQHTQAQMEEKKHGWRRRRPFTKC